MVFFTGSHTLKVLDCSRNDIGDNEMALILEALQYNKSLTELQVAQCSSSVKGTAININDIIKYGMRST